MKIEKRLPFGFVGDWGKLYKKYTTEQTATLKPLEEITYERSTYRDIGMDVQFKRVADEDGVIEQPSTGIVKETEYTVVKTTDAYFDDNSKSYLCVISPGDIVKVFGKLWLVCQIKTVIKHNPAEQKFFYCDLKGIL